MENSRPGKTPRSEARKIADRKYYERHREEIRAKAALSQKEGYEKKKDTEAWKEQKRQINKRYREKRKEREREEKELLFQLQDQLKTLTENLFVF